MMRSTTRSFVIVLTAASAVLAACGQEAAEAAPNAEAVTAVEIDGSDRMRLTLSEQAAERLGIVTEVVTEDPVSGHLIIPYSALMYDASGLTWTYTSPEGLVFIRERVEVDSVDGDIARLTAGPEVDTLVVTIGAAELWGAETGVGGGH